MFPWDIRRDQIPTALVLVIWMLQIHSETNFRSNCEPNGQERSRLIMYKFC